jgi:hypothetical protein
LENRPPRHRLLCRRCHPSVEGNKHRLRRWREGRAPTVAVKRLHACIKKYAFLQNVIDFLNKIVILKKLFYICKNKPNILLTEIRLVNLLNCLSLLNDHLKVTKFLQLSLNL